MLDIPLSRALQQPDWDDPAQVRRVVRALSERPPLVRAQDVRALRDRLARVAAGECLVVQAGDCAENPDECTPGHVGRKVAALDAMAGALSLVTNKPVLRVGRIGGQFAKPRSSAVETVDGVTLPAFRGHLVNSPETTEEARRPDPLRLLTGYMAAGDIMDCLGWRGSSRIPADQPRVWTSHEALLLDYEMPLVRRDGAGPPVLGSTHWPWIGERTRQADGPHTALLSRVANPVACKVGPTTTARELLALCERLDPMREPGRLTLIARMGAGRTAHRLPALVTAVRAAGFPVIWMCDPMHGNTVTTGEGHKTRVVATLAREVGQFVAAVEASGGVAGGLHLETTPDDVTECVTDESDFGRVGERYTSVCDPRLTRWQALSVVVAWGSDPEAPGGTAADIQRTEGKNLARTTRV